MLDNIIQNEKRTENFRKNFQRRSLNFQNRVLPISLFKVYICSRMYVFTNVLYCII